ncbi:GDYXXLXY domain-containing protein [Lutibacter citreus]|uniref:GDYXXLXY domain-containing protein n=1 Tax=Lutibacter citreus TaxID=2138210 RepID=UPI000DBE7294|nr:GDYXXLXY domain-containing protein [Lutibacter citreus]
MKNKKLLFTLFIAVVIAQLFVPFKMILSKEDTLKTGTPYKFITAPIDPTDPFRGKFIVLSFIENEFNIEDEKEWKRNEIIFVLLQNNKDGFATIKSIVKEKPAETSNDFIEAKVDRVYATEKNKRILIQYPFERYYMEEFKAKDAENTYRESQRDNMNKTYALVYVKNGEAVLKDVLINGKPIKQIVEENSATNK